VSNEIYSALIITFSRGEKKMVTPSLRKLRYVLISRSTIQVKPLPRNNAIYGEKISDGNVRGAETHIMLSPVQKDPIEPV
jgi:hypothetical protein